MSTFTILKQQDPSGCIPTCAASVLRYLGIPRPDWSEASLMGMYACSLPNNPPPPGFELLKTFLDGQPEMKGWEVVITDGAGSAAKNLVSSVVSKHGPALMPFNGASAHCVVIIQPDETGAVICDPSPNQPDQQRMNWADIERKWIGGLLYFQSKGND